MASNVLVDILIYGMTTSALYALLSIGLALIFGTAGVLNLAHAAFLTIGGYSVYFFVSANVPVQFALLLSLVVTATFSVVIYRVFVKPVEDRPFVYIIGLLVITFIVREIIGLWFSVEPRSIPSLIQGNLTVLGVTITWNQVTAFVLSWILIGVVWYFAFHTTTGQSVMAMSMDEKGAATIGINTDRMILLVWAISAVMAGIAGYFFGSLTSLTPRMGFEPLLISLVIIVLGGMGSIKGALVASYFIGFVETISVFMIDPAANGILSFAAVILVLLVRSEGLFEVRETDTGF